MNLPKQIEKEIQAAFDLQKSKNYSAAEKIYDNLYKKYKENSTLLTLYGILKIQTQDYENAINLLEMSLKLDKDNEITLCNLGIVFFNIKKFEESAEFLNRAILLNSNNPNYFYHLGNSLRKLKCFNQACTNYQKALNLKNDDIQSLFGLASTYKEINQLSAAVIIFKKIITIECSNIEALFETGSILLKLKKFNSAISYFDRLLKLDNSNTDALFNKGVCLNKLNKLYDALNCYNEILNKDSNNIDTLINRGLILKTLGFYNDYGALFNLSLLKLLEGNFSEGLKLYEHRKELNLGRYKFSPKPTWLNNFSLKNKIILIFSDQGLGDFIQCYRYITLLKKLGARIILLTPKPLTKIIQNQSLEISVIEEGQTIPAFDFECPIMSLPYAFKTVFESIPCNVPYLKADNKLNIQSSLRGNSFQKVGIVWKGSAEHDDDARRSIPVKILEQLFKEKFEFHIIQKDLNQEERIFLTQFDNIVIHSDHLNDFYDTSLVINEMNFIISVDTSVAHLAGAMNKKTYLLLPFSPDFRWLLNFKTSPWYPSFNIIRQTSFNNWQSVIDDLIFNSLKVNLV
jgi:tetratricopeptide (TPR) repeat protein